MTASVFLTLGVASLSALGAVSTADVGRELRKIESAKLRSRNEIDVLRLDYERRLRDQPNDPLIRVYVAWCATVSDDGWNQLRGVSQMNPDSPWPHYGMGRIYLSWKMVEAAKGEFELALRSAQFSPALVGLADVERSLQHFAAAETLYRQALALNDDPLAHTGLALTLVAIGQAQAAKSEFMVALNAWPDQPAALEALVPLLVEAHDETALALAERWVALKPKDRKARRQLGDIRFEAGDKRGAAQDYERLLLLGDPSVDVVKRLSSYYRELDDASSEQRVVELLVGLNRKDPLPLLRLAEMKAAHRDLLGAQAELLSALERDPGRAATLVVLAKVLEQAKAPLEAFVRLREAAALEGPDAEAARQAVAELEARYRLPRTPINGSIEAIQAGIARSLDAFFVDRKKLNPRLGGTLSLRVAIQNNGQVKKVEVARDTLGDSLLLGHAVLALRDAQFEPRERDAIFEFELGSRRK